MMTYNDCGPATKAKIDEVVEACVKYGASSVIALAGVPGTGKSFMGRVAAQRFTDEPLRVREIQFHPSFSYEEFVEGLRLRADGGVEPRDGVFLEWNRQAESDPDNRYVLLIDELTRANLPSVFGELLTYIEYRDRPFYPTYSRSPVRIVDNLTIIATYNPVDRSALELDDAFLRRLRIIQCPPDEGQMGEMLSAKLNPSVIEKLKDVFATCRQKWPKEFEHLMPFGHGIFSEVESEKPDLYELWEGRIRHFLHRPLRPSSKFASAIEEAYPWQDSNYSVPVAAATQAQEEEKDEPASEQQTAAPKTGPELGQQAEPEA